MAEDKKKAAPSASAKPVAKATQKPATKAATPATKAGKPAAKQTVRKEDVAKIAASTAQTIKKAAKNIRNFNEKLLFFGFQSCKIPSFVLYF